LDLDVLTPDVIVAFLSDREQARRNRASTRNVRLAAIHAFFRFVASVHPEHLEQCQRVLAIPFKCSTARVVEYLEYPEIQAALLTIDRTTRDGRRDYALLATMFNTGARVQEILDLRPSDVQLVSPAHVRLFGKGRKERLCPLWPQTAQLLRAYISERGLTPASTQPLFVNHRGAPLTRFGVRYLLAKYCDRARTMCPSLEGKRLHPHSRPSPEGGCRSPDHQSLARSRQPEYHSPLRGHRLGEQGPRSRKRDPPTATMSSRRGDRTRQFSNGSPRCDGHQ
jgi:integrase/recombinase XerD